MTEKQYTQLRNRALYRGYLYGFSVMDCEDILHDSCLHIVYEKTPENQWGKILYKYIGKYRERRHRESKRQISLEDSNEPNLK